jgi:hypothetical protein
MKSARLLNRIQSNNDYNYISNRALLAMTAKVTRIRSILVVELVRAYTEIESVKCIVDISTHQKNETNIRNMPAVDHNLIPRTAVMCTGVQERAILFVLNHAV